MKTNLKKWIYIAIGAVVFLCIGIIYSWSVFAQVFSNSFKSWTSTELATTFTIIMAFFCVGNISGGIFLKKASPKIVMMISGILIGAGFIGVSQVRESSILLLYASYGMISSFGVGMVYNVVISVITKWFHDRVGMASGILMMSFAFSPLVLGMQANRLMGIYDWRLIFTLLGIFITVVVLTSSIFLKFPDGINEKLQNTNDNTKDNGMTVSQMLKTPSFWLFFVWGIMILVSVYGVLGNAKQTVLELDKNAVSIATLSVTIISVFNGLGRLILGAAYDKLGRKKTMTIVSIAILLSSLFMIAAFKSSSITLMVIGFILTGFSYGGVPPTSSAFTVDYFGRNNFSMKFGIINLFIFVGAFGSTLAGIIKDTAGSFQNLFYILIGFGVISMILNLSIKSNKKKAA